MASIVNYENLEFSVPDCWEDVSIEKFAFIVNLLEKEEDTQKRNLGVAKILTGIDLGDLPYEVGIKIFGLMGFLQSINDVINLSGLPAGEFTFEGERYVVPQTIHNITFNQYWDFDKLMELYSGNKILHQAALIIAMFCVKDGESYDFARAKEREKKFRNIDCLTANRILNGFFLQSHALNLSMKACSTAQEELRRQMTTLETSIKNGSGNRLSSAFAKSFLKLLKRQNPEPSTGSSDSSPTKRIWTILGKLGIRKKARGTAKNNRQE